MKKSIGNVQCEQSKNNNNVVYLCSDGFERGGRIEACSIADYWELDLNNVILDSDLSK